jgi:hypothetical protein
MCGERAEKCAWENETNCNKPLQNDISPIKSGIKERLSILAVLFTRLLVQRSGWCDFLLFGEIFNEHLNYCTERHSQLHCLQVG